MDSIFFQFCNKTGYDLAYVLYFCAKPVAKPLFDHKDHVVQNLKPYFIPYFITIIG